MCIAAKSSVDGKEISSKSDSNTNSDFIVPLKVPWDITPYKMININLQWIWHDFCILDKLNLVLTSV